MENKNYHKMSKLIESCENIFLNVINISVVQHVKTQCELSAGSSAYTHSLRKLFIQPKDI